MVIGVVIGCGGTDGHASIGGVIGVGEGATETFFDTALVAIICEGTFAVEQALPGIIVGVVEDSIVGYLRTEGSAGALDGLSVVSQGALVQAHPAATGSIVESEGGCGLWANCNTDPGGVVTISHKARIYTDGCAIIAEGAETALESTEPCYVISGVSAV